LKRIVPILAVLVAGVAIYLLLLGGSDPKKPDQAAPAAIDAGVDAAAQATVPTPPPLAEQPAEPRPQLPPPGSFSFDAEVRDPAWADEQEKELTLRLQKLMGTVPVKFDIDGIECRRTLCRIAMRARDAASLGKVYGALEEPTGLLGWADHLLLETVITEDDGRVRTGVLAVFERDPTP
jgi:type IV secretory pathway VirB10-like protein